MKELFSYTVNLEKEVEKTETKEENGTTISVTKKVKEDVPYRIIIKQPSKKNIEDGGLQFSVEMSNCIKKGILTKGMLSKKYSDTGGILSETDANELVSLYNTLTTMENDYIRLSSKTERDLDAEAALAAKITATRSRMVQLESSYQVLFNNTADTIAQNNVIRWFCLNMAHSQVLPDGKIEPMFKGESTEEKLASMHEMDESEDELYVKAYRKLATFMSFWYFSKNAKKEDFEKLERDIEEGKFN